MNKKSILMLTIWLLLAIALLPKEIFYENRQMKGQLIELPKSAVQTQHRPQRLS